MYCSKCGAKLLDNAAACSACGQVVAGQTFADSAKVALASTAPPPGASQPWYPPPPPYGYPQQATPYPPPYAYPPVPPSPYAGFGQRVGAYLIDSFIVGIVTSLYAVLAFFWLGLDYFRQIGESLSKGDPVFPTALLVAILLLSLASLVTGWLYHALQESGPRQGTVGKNILGIVVTDMQGQHISFGRATGRFFARIIAGMLPMALGFIMAAFTEKKQALHDMIAGCLVMKKT